MRAHHYLLITAALWLTACQNARQAEPTHPEADRIDVDIRWTSYGIPHVKANDWKSLGYGFAYAVAEDAICVLAEVLVTVNGERSRYFGADQRNRASDIFHKGLLDTAVLAHAREGQPPQMAAMGDGYVAGFNRYLADHQGRLPNSCHGKPWVRPMTDDDMTRIAVGVGIRYGLGNFMREIAGAQPPGSQVGALRDYYRPPQDDELGSNAYAIGQDLSANGRGILLGNPHYPWQGPSRFHLGHLIIPGELNVMGVGLYTTTTIAIGFNEDIAWSHTVSSALRFTPYRLDLVEGDPLRYRYGDEQRPLVPRTVEIEVRQEDGTLRRESHTIYMSHYGPVIAGASLPWDHRHVYTLRDVNLHNNRSGRQYYRIDRARSVEELAAALAEEQGVSWVNTIAADRHGKALYADLSVVPNVTARQLQRCRPDGAERLGRLGQILLNGSDPSCEWQVSTQAAQAGIMPPHRLPKLITTSYVTNSNDSYWLSNPEERLEGFSPIIGSERSARSLRTRAGLEFIREVIGADGKGRFTADTVQDIMFNHRNYGAELLLDDLLQACRSAAGPIPWESGQVDVRPACEILADWDRRQDVESRGAHIYTEFWRLAQRIPDLFRVPFDNARPIDTPAGLDTGNPAVLEALAGAVARLRDAGLALDAPWGELQYVVRGDSRIPVPGGSGASGMFSNISAGLQDGKGYTPVVSGNSYIQVVTWDDDGNPDARAILTYSQSQEPESPHYADQTELYARGEWIRLPFTEAEIAADLQRELTLTD